MNTLQERLIDFAVSIIKLVESVEKDPLMESTVKQIIRSSTSVGANYSESQASSSYRDFYNKVKIAHKELKETEYWVVYLSKVKKNKIDTSIIEAEIIELRRIFSTITKKAELTLSQMKNK